ncbi:MAG: sensor domain-containing diguanylate cyclase [Thermodesulfobacteriota bacterium]|nr:MAG: sensor domain-containing diguanylate cyclase [Thermodesulfobacteriota bacterium]
MGNKPVKNKEARLRISQLSTFNEVGKTLTSSLDLKEILKIVMEKIRELLHPGNWSLLLMDEETKDLKFEIAVGKGSEKIRGMRLKSGEGIAGWVAREKKPVLVTDVTKDPRYSKKVDSITNYNTRSIICVPLVARDRCLGVIELINRPRSKVFTDEDLTLLTTLADYTAIAIENAIYFKRIHELTITDDLTKLYNARYLHMRLNDEVERARRFGYDLSMIFIDLDYFKKINDNHGHLCGSKLLAEVGSLLKKIIRSVDMAFRYGGDEFIILMPETPKKNARIVANKIRTELKKAVFLKEEGVNCRITASFGVASYPKDAADKTELIHMADNAMYRVKDKSRDGVAVA